MSKESENLEIGKAYDLAPGMTAVEMRAMFFDSDAIVETPERIYRLDSSGHRYYYKFDEHGNPEFFVSVTTLIKQTTPTSPHLIKWIADMGYDESRAYAQERADYGTFMHKEIAELLLTREYDTDKLRSNLLDYIEANRLPSDFVNHEDELKKDVLAFAQFMIEHKVRPLAVEVVLSHPRDGYAGAVDMVCLMEIEEMGEWGEVYKTGKNAGKPKRTKARHEVLAMVDFKSGRKNFYEDNEIQLAAYKELWNENFPDRPVDRIYNWSPKDWRGATPTYNLKDQTNSKSQFKLPYLVEIARIEDDKRDKTVNLVSGKISLDNGLSDNIESITLSEVVKRRKSEKEEKQLKKFTDEGED